MPLECRPGRIASFVVDFLATLTAGDQQAAASFLTDTSFVYSVVGPEGISLDPLHDQQRRAFADYVGERHDHGERLRLIELVVADTYRRSYLGIDTTEVAGVAYLLLRYADDFDRNPLRYSGKANLICREGLIFNWQMVPEHRPFEHRCPAPRPKLQGDFVVACTDE